MGWAAGRCRRARAARRWLVVGFVLVTAASQAWAEEFDFAGPAPTRNFQPIQLIFLALPFESAVTLEHGGLELLLESAEINVIATTSGAIESTLKFETNRTVFGFRYGLFDRWEVGMELPFISRYGGFLDPIIDGVEDLFGAVNPERKLFSQNVFGGFSVVRGDTTLFQGDAITFQPGDLSFLLKYAVPVPRAWPRLALRAAIKAPTGSLDEVTGSGEPDFGIGVAADYQVFDRLMLYGNLNLVYPVGPITAGDLTLNPIFTESFAAHFAVTQRWSAMLHQAVYTSPFHGTNTRLLDGEVVELGFGINFVYSPKFAAQLLGIQNFSGVEQSADFTLLLSMQIRPWGQPTRLPPIGAPPPAPLPQIGEPLPRAPAAEDAAPPPSP